ncbi:MAG: hypothetical protein KBB54_02570 [Candidatus Pacebacteria bacterium]|nr:hypothetical protein [Candidatus Paceibacterota bacterium]MBP9818853.1 hypothetical protein [Candidatus Paceibacterota bacterium]
MSTNGLKIKKWKKTHKELLKFIENENTVTGDEIRDWIAKCIVYFTEIGVQPHITDFFLSRLEFHKEKSGKKNFILYNPAGFNDEEDNYEYETGIGPFIFSSNERGYIVKNGINRLENKQADRTRMTPILVAFKVAENILNNYEEEERIIPSNLLTEFNTEKTQGIYLAIQGIQNAYEKKDSKNILASVITTTSLVFNLIPELASVKDIGPKIKKAYETEKIYKKYNLNREILWGINNSRIIRNYDIHNPKNENHTTLQEALGYCHLLVLLISSLLASGEIKL